MSYLNDEQTLELCLSLCALDEKAFEGIAGEFITYYIIQESPNISDIDISIRSLELINDKIIRNLSSRGFLNVNFLDDGSIGYIPTEEI